MTDTEADGGVPESAPYTPSTPSSYCAIVGPSGAGKTNLILSFVRACTLPPTDPFQIRLRHIARTQRLFRRAAAFTPHAVPPAATDDVLPHEFEVDVSTEDAGISKAIRRLAEWKPGWFGGFGRSPLTSTALFRVIDGPGGDLFPSSEAPLRDASARARLVREIETAQSLVLCINATNPQSENVRTELPLILSELSGRGGSLRFARVYCCLRRSIGQQSDFWTQFGGEAST